MAIPDVSTTPIYEGELQDSVMSQVTHIRGVIPTGAGSILIPKDEFVLPASQINNGSSVTGATVDDALTQLNTEKEDAANKKTAINDSDTEFPTSKAVKTALDLKVDDSQIYNGLDKTVSGFALDAMQGGVLEDKILDAQNVYTEITNTAQRADMRLTSTGNYVADTDFNILAFPVVVGKKIRLKGSVNKPCYCIFSNSASSIGTSNYISTIFSNSQPSGTIVDVDVTMDVPSGATYARVSEAKTLDIDLFDAVSIKDIVDDHENRIDSLELIVGERQTTSLDSSIITPNNIYTVCNDENVNRNYSACIYLSHLINGSLASFKNKKLYFSNRKRSRFINSPFTIDPTFNGGVAKSDTTVNETIISECKYINKDITFNHRSTLCSQSKSIAVRHLSIGDSITNGYLSDLNKNPSTLPNRYCDYMKMLFEMDKIDGGNVESEYNCLALGKGTLGSFTLDYGGITKTLKSYSEAKGGASLVQLRQSQWGSPLVLNPFWSGSDFSVLSYLEKYKTMDVNGNRLYFNNSGSTTGTGGSLGYIYSGGSYVLSDEYIGTSVTNTESYDVCIPSSISIQLSQNSTLAMFQENIAAIISIIQTELPLCKIILMCNDGVVSYFPEDYQEYKEQDITQSAGFSAHLSNVAIFNYLKTSIENEANGIYVLANLFVQPDAKSLPTIQVDSSDSIMSNEVILENQQVYGLSTYAHPNNRAHASWGYQLYGLLKYINS